MGSDPRLLAEQRVRRRPRDAEAIQPERPVRAIVEPNDVPVRPRGDGHEPCRDRRLEETALGRVQPTLRVLAMAARDPPERRLDIDVVLLTEPRGEPFDEEEVARRDLSGVLVDLDVALTRLTRDDREIPVEGTEEFDPVRLVLEALLRRLIHHDLLTCCAAHLGAEVC